MKLNRQTFLSSAALIGLGGFLAAAPLAVQAETSVPVASIQSGQTANSSSGLAQFVPSSDRKDHRIDYQHWDEALEWMVIPMGPSVREGAPRVTPGTGTRRIYGHMSRYRLEGNRVAFSFLSPDIKGAVSAYRQDLERIGTELDLAKLPRNEQLAYWLNLHNVAVIEAIAEQYPMRQPSEREFGSNEAGLQDAKLVTVKGVELSPRDIREKIVYPNWKDPKVMYGFWRGEIGGPSIQRLAFNGANVDTLLALSGEEFVNSLRGVEAFNGKLRVSQIFKEAAPFYFASDADLRVHIEALARDDVKALMGKYQDTAYNSYEGDIADMLAGNSDPGLTNVCLQGRGEGAINDQWGAPEGRCNAERIVTDRAAQRLMFERAQKLNKAYRRGIRTGSVTIGNYDPDAPIKEVD